MKKPKNHISTHPDTTFYENLLGMVQGHMYWKDLDSVYLGCNTLQAIDAGLNSREEIIGLTDYDMPWKEDADFLRKIDSEVIRTKQPIVVEEKSKTASGKEAIWLTNKAPLLNQQGEIIGVVGTSIDITELKQSQKQAEEAQIQAVISRTKAEAEEDLRNTILDFAGSMAHDQRSPIMTVYHIAMNYERILPILLDVYEKAKEKNLVENNLLTKRDFDYVKNHSGINALKHVSTEMNSFIDNSLHNLKIAQKAQSGQIDAEDFIVCEMYKCLNQIPFNFAIQENEINLVHIDTRYDFSFKGNYVLLNHVFSNLLINSLYQIRKNKKGEIFVKAEDNGNKNIVRFKDTAGGAPPDIIARIFEGYYTTKEDGTGVGLAFCKKMMKLIGGDITCHSIYGDYIEFVLEFPKIE